MITLRSLSLRHKILIFSTLLVILPGALFGFLAERNGRDSLERIIGRELAREAGHTADRLETLIRVERETLDSFARQDFMREIRFLDLDKRISQALSTLQSGAAPRVGYLVVDEAGVVVAGTNPRWLETPPAWSAPALFEQAVSGIVEDPSDDSGLLIATSIPDPDRPGERLGMLLGRLNWSLLTDVCDSVRQELSSQGLAAEIAILGTGHRLLRRSTDAERESANAETLVSIASGGGERPGFVVDAQAGWIAGRANFSAGEESWGLLVVEPLSHALAPATQLRNRLMITIALALTLALVFAAYGVERVVRPLSELTRAIREVARGDSSGVAVPVRSEDEVGTLAKAFNKMIADLDRTHHQLVEAEKFALVGQLAAGVAHEVRTSLAVLRSSAQILGRMVESEPDPSAREMVDMIGAEVLRLSRVVDDLLTLDHQRPMELRPTPLSIPLRAALDFVAPQAQEKGVAIDDSSLEASLAGSPIVLCDREAIQQVGVNLLSNAIAALSEGHQIVVTIEAPADSQASFTIRDDGEGIPADLHDRIFEPFVTGRKAGVGLGLTVVKRMIHENRGTVELADHDEKGACFRVTLPLAEERE